MIKKRCDVGIETYHALLYREYLEYIHLQSFHLCTERGHKEGRGCGVAFVWGTGTGDNVGD